MSTFLLNNELTESRQEAISRGVITARALIHFRHYFRESTDKSQKDHLRLELSRAVETLLDWTAEGIDAAATLIHAGFSCDSDCCKEASMLGPKGLYQMLDNEDNASPKDSENISFCRTGTKILHFTVEGNLSQNWRCPILSIALAQPSEAAAMLGCPSLNINMSSRPDETMLQLIDEKFLGNLRYRTVERRKSDYRAHPGPGLFPRSHNPFESPSRTSLASVDTSAISRAAWGDGSRHFSYP